MTEQGKQTMKIGEIKSTNFAFCLIIVCVGIIGGMVSSLQGLNVLLSFEVGFVGFVCVVMSSFVAIIKRIQSQEERLDSESLESMSEVQGFNQGTDSKNSESKPQTPKYSKFIMGTQVSFSLLRLLSYGFFTLALVGLMLYGVLHLWGLFAGMILAMILLVGLGIYAFCAWH